MLDIVNLSIEYDRVIFNDLNIYDIKPGLNFIIGRSGCGKSSLIKAIIGLNNFAKGDIIFKNKKIEDFNKFREEYVSIVFQEDNLIEYYTIYENLLLTCNDINKIKKYLKLIHLENKLYKYPSSLSGGERQRINIIRAILKNSFINIFDEPTSNVNDSLKLELMQLIKLLFKDKIVIIISHNKELVNKFADRIIDIEFKKDILINKQIENNDFKTKINPNIFKLTMLSYKKRNILPIFVICLIYIVVLTTISLFGGINRYIEYNIEKKVDYNYFYIENINDNLINELKKYNIEIIKDYRSYINNNFFDKIKFNNKTLNEYFEIHIYDGDDLLINEQLYELVKTDKLIFNDKEYVTKIINDGKLYTSPSIYFSYNFLNEKFNNIENNNFAFKTNYYQEVYSFLSKNISSIYSINEEEGPIFYNSTIMINDSLKPLLNSLHSLLIVLTYSVLGMAITFIKSLVTYNLKIRKKEIEILDFFGYKKINNIAIYESFILTFLPFCLSLFIFYYLITFLNKLSIYLLNEYFPILKLTSKTVLFSLLIVLIINIIIYYGFRFSKNKQKI